MSTFVMRLSQFDSSHQEGVPGTPEILIPLDARRFFPPMKLQGQKYPDAYFTVALEVGNEKEMMEYRLWDYEERATGTKINECRLRTNHKTRDLINPSGRDLIVIKKVDNKDYIFEVKIISSGSQSYNKYYSKCNRLSNKKEWGIF